MIHAIFDRDDKREVSDHSMVPGTWRPLCRRLYKAFCSAVERYLNFKMEYIASPTASDKHQPAIVEILAPQEKIGIIDDPLHLDASSLQGKIASLHLEFMLACPLK